MSHPALKNIARLIAKQAVREYLAQQRQQQSGSQPQRTNPPVQSGPTNS